MGEQLHVQPPAKPGCIPVTDTVTEYSWAGRDPRGSSSPNVSERQYRVLVALGASSAGQLCYTQRKLQHALHSPKAAPLCSAKHFQGRSCYLCYSLLSSVRWVRSSVESLRLIPLWQRKSCKMYGLSIIGRKCKRKEVCEWEKVSVSSLADLEVMSNLLRSRVYKSEGLCVVSWSMCANTFCVWTHCLESKRHLQHCLFHQTPHFQQKISYYLGSLNTMYSLV